MKRLGEKMKKRERKTEENFIKDGEKALKRLMCVWFYVIKLLKYIFCGIYKRLKGGDI